MVKYNREKGGEIMLGFIIVCLIIGGITLLCPEFLVDTYRGSSRRKVDENTYLRAKKVAIIFLAIVMTIVVVYTVGAVKENKTIKKNLKQLEVEMKIEDGDGTDNRKETSSP